MRRVARTGVLALAALIAACGPDSPEDGAAPRPVASTDDRPASTANPFCAPGELPASLEGESPVYVQLQDAAEAPSDGEAGMAGLPARAVFLRQTPYGLFVRFVDRTPDPRPVSVRIQASAPIVDAAVVPDGAGELVVDGSSLEYLATPGPRGSGINLPVCRFGQLLITIERDGSLVDPEEIHVGASSTAIENPVRLERS